MLPTKDTRELLYSMLKAGFVSLQVSRPKLVSPSDGCGPSDCNAEEVWLCRCGCADRCGELCRTFLARRTMPRREQCTLSMLISSQRVTPWQPGSTARH